MPASCLLRPLAVRECPHCDRRPSRPAECHRSRVGGVHNAGSHRRRIGWLSRLHADNALADASGLAVSPSSGALARDSTSVDHREPTSHLARPWPQDTLVARGLRTCSPCSAGQNMRHCVLAATVSGIWSVRMPSTVGGGALDSPLIIGSIPRGGLRPGLLVAGPAARGEDPDRGSVSWPQTGEWSGARPRHRVPRKQHHLNRHYWIWPVVSMGVSFMTVSG